MAAILISVDDINFENLSCNKRGVHIWGELANPNASGGWCWGSCRHPNLLRYLDSGYVVADEGEKAQFIELLELEDDKLVAVLMGELAVDSVKIKYLLGKIRAFAVVEN